MHKFGYSCTADCNTLSIQFLGYTCTSIPLLKFIKQRFNPSFQRLLSLRDLSCGVFRPFVIRPTTDIKHFTHLLNGMYIAVLGYEPVDFPSLLEKKRTAFFKMSRSSFTSANSFFKAAIFAS